MLDLFYKIGIPIISVLITLIATIFAGVKGKKEKKKTMLNALIPNLIITAETLFGSKKGQAKLDYVLTQAQLFALQNHLKFDMTEYTAKVNNLIECTNRVNTDKSVDPFSDGKDINFNAQNNQII